MVPANFGFRAALLPLVMAGFGDLDTLLLPVFEFSDFDFFGFFLLNYNTAGTLAMAVRHSGGEVACQKR